MSGLNAIDGSVNYVSRQPTAGPIRNEADAYLDSFGSFRSHFGSGGSTPVRGLDYRFDVSGAKYNSFIDSDFRDVTGLATQLNYRVTEAFSTFVAVRSRLLGDAGRSGLVCRVACGKRRGVGHRD
jgi:iron complex outermembrane receptor protein